MKWLQNIYTYFQSFFEFLTFRSKPKYDQINDIENNNQEYEFIILNNKMNR